MTESADTLTRQDCLTLLRSGPEGVAEWNRQWQPNDDAPNLTGIDLSDSDLRGVSLCGAILDGANLENSDLTDADLAAAHLSDSNLVGSKLLRTNLESARLVGAKMSKVTLSSASLESADFSNADLTEAFLVGITINSGQFVGATLRNATLRGAHLRQADLSSADMTGATLDEADLFGAQLNRTTLSESSLRNANLSRAYFFGANLRGAVLDGANLAGASVSFVDLQEASLVAASAPRASFYGVNAKGVKLVQTNLSGAGVTAVKLADAILGDTDLVNVDLSGFCRASGLQHRSPSSVDYRSILRSANEPNLKDFLLAVGVPPCFTHSSIECIQKSQQSFRMPSVFLSCGQQDEGFADKLSEALRDNGVRTFVFKRDAIPGQRLDQMMREEVNNHDYMILICSEASLQRPGVLNELTEILARESRVGGGQHLIPIKVDDYVFTRWAPQRSDLKQAVLDRVVADFTDPDQFDTQLKRLVMALYQEGARRG